MKVFLNLLGIVVVIGLIFLISWDRKNIRWKAVGKAIIAQFVIAILLVKVPVGKMVVSAISDGVTAQLSTADRMVCHLYSEALQTAVLRQEVSLSYRHLVTLSSYLHW